MTKNFAIKSAEIKRRLKEEILIGDGAMGTLLYNRGVSLDANFEHLNLVQPEQVQQVHADYIAAGANLIETNTFGANLIRLGAIGLGHKVHAINLAGARLAREVAGKNVLVAGSVGPVGRSRGHDTALEQDEQHACFQQQVAALVEGEVDLLLLETFADLSELEAAVKVAVATGLPVISQFALLAEGRTRDGFSAEQAARRLTEAGAAMIGVNCGAGPRELLQVLQRLASATTLPLSAFPNSGFPEYVDGRSIYLSTPDYFMSRAREMVAAGATLIGGCCGTGPEHIRALATALKDAQPAPERRVEVVVSEPEAHRAPIEGKWLTRHKVPVTVELDPPCGLDCRKLLSDAQKLVSAGVSALSLAENPLARIRMGNIALASRIYAESGADVIVHVTGRDRNLIGLHSELLGAHLLGLRNVLAVTGDPVSVSGEAGATSVFDLNSIGLLEMLSAMNGGQTLYGQKIGEPTRFFSGAAFNPNANLLGQLTKLKKKVAAGAQFVQTQPVYSREVLEAMLQATADIDIPILIGILPLVSERNAEFLHNEVPGILLPESVRARMHGTSGESGRREGVAIARELIDAGRGQVDGFYLMPPFGRVDLALELLEYIRS
jgi:homocysteine S-methyltransferase